MRGDRVGALSQPLEFGYRVARKRTHRHVAATAEEWREFLQHKEYLAVMGARIILRLDIDQPDLPGIGTTVEIAPGHANAPVPAYRYH
ncbi:hypothetical protein SXCC_00759 [Gluconacetobacter sp. SXCC-1]|nr:hypothetical protein SXCC_00759 [Gluconacetobacter sp. SXCC-1]